MRANNHNLAKQKIVVVPSENCGPIGIVFPDGLTNSISEWIISEGCERLFRMSPKSYFRSIRNDIRHIKQFLNSVYSHFGDKESAVLELLNIHALRVAIASTKISEYSVEYRILSPYMDPEFDNWASMLDVQAMLDRYPWFMKAFKGIRYLVNSYPIGCVFKRVFDEVETWDKLDADCQRRTANAVFALSSLSSSTVVLDAACSIAPSLRVLLEPFQWEPDPIFIEADNHPACDARLIDAITALKYSLPTSIPPEQDPWMQTLFELIPVQRVTSVYEECRDALKEHWFQFIGEKFSTLETNIRIAGNSADDVSRKASETLHGLLNRLPAWLESAKNMPMTIHSHRSIRDFVVDIEVVVDLAEECINSLKKYSAEIRELSDDPLSNLTRINEITTIISDVQSEIDTYLADIQKMAATKPAFESAKVEASSALIAHHPDTVSPAALKCADAGSPTICPSDHEALMTMYVQLESEAQGLRRRCHELDQANQHLTNQFRLVRISDDTLMNDAELLRTIFLCESTPEDLLRTVAALYGEARIVVLPSAYESARASKDFQNTRDLARYLDILAGAYVDAMRGGEAERGRKLFPPGVFAPQEHPAITEDPKYSNHRMFEYEGKPVEMFTHLKLGVSKDVRHTMRIHFHWDHIKGRVVLGHAGPHLPNGRT